VRCTECEVWSEALTSARSAFVLGRPSEDLVHALKYEGWPELAAPMGDAMARVLTRQPDVQGRPRIVVPVPTTRERERSRGYNQAELLARRVAERADLPLARALTRAGGGGSQTRLSPSERAANVRGAFRAASLGPDVVRGAAVVLVDDVLTTGATASEAASVLSAMGAESVLLLTYARALATAPEKAR
jgi:ComF family protein